MKDLRLFCIANSVVLVGMAFTSCSNDDVTPEIYDDDAGGIHPEYLRLEENENVTLESSEAFKIIGVDSLGTEVTLSIAKEAEITRSPYKDGYKKDE